MKWRTAKSGVIDHSDCQVLALLETSGAVLRVIATLLIFAPPIAVRPVNAQTTSPAAAGMLLEAGIEKENVDGDLKAAMSIYEKIAIDQSVYMSSDPQGNSGIFEAPFSGGRPRRVGDMPADYRFAYSVLVFSPDGRKVLAMGFGPPKYDLWALENFEPKTSK